MIVAADVQVGDFKPEIEIDVILLAALEGLVFFAARSSHDQELVIEAANGVTVARVLHIVHEDAVEHVGVVLHDLIALFERGGLALNVATTDEEELVGRSLHVGEVVLEVLRDVDGAAEHLLLCQIVLVDSLGVALKHEDRLDLGRTVIGLGWLEWLRLRGLSTSTRSSHRWAPCNLLKGSNCVVSSRVLTAQASLFVRDVLVILPVTSTVCAVDAEAVLEQLCHDSVGELHLHLFVALRAGQVLVLFVSLSDATLVSSELDKAIIAGASSAPWALKYSRQHQHADGALKVLRLDTETGIIVEVALLHAVLSPSLYHLDFFLVSCDI